MAKQLTPRMAKLTNERQDGEVLAVKEGDYWRVIEPRDDRSKSMGDNFAFFETDTAVGMLIDVDNNRTLDSAPEQPAPPTPEEQQAQHNAAFAQFVLTALDDDAVAAKVRAIING